MEDSKCTGNCDQCDALPTCDDPDADAYSEEREEQDARERRAYEQDMMAVLYM